MENRGNEATKLWFRTPRLFRANGYWYFCTRENIDVGPYRTEFEANVEADILINLLREEPLERAERVVRDFAFDSPALVVVPNSTPAQGTTSYLVSESETSLTIDAVLG